MIRVRIPAVILAALLPFASFTVAAQATPAEPAKPAAAAKPKAAKKAAKTNPAKKSDAPKKPQVIRKMNTDKPLTLRDKDGNVIPTSPDAYNVDSALPPKKR